MKKGKTITVNAQKLTRFELKESKGQIIGSGSNFPLPAPCSLEIDCGDGTKYTCSTYTAGEKCNVLLFSVGGGSYEPFGIICGKEQHQCSDHNTSGSV